MPGRKGGLGAPKPKVLGRGRRGSERGEDKNAPAEWGVAGAFRRQSVLGTDIREGRVI